MKANTEDKLGIIGAQVGLFIGKGIDTVVNSELSQKAQAKVGTVAKSLKDKFLTVTQKVREQIANDLAKTDVIKTAVERLKRGDL